MNKLYKKLSKYSLNDAINTEKIDVQYISISKLYNKINSENLFLPLIIANCLVCYQLSSTGEKYWEEFYLAASKYSFSDISSIIKFFNDFLPNSSGNKRFVKTKMGRLKKVESYLKEFENKQKHYYENMDKLNFDLARAMNQKNDAKTIVFAVKMFSYGARTKFNELIQFPFEISIPLDSRLKNLYEKYHLESSNEKYSDKEAKKFYEKISENLKIPQLHLDALIWVNYNELIS